MVLSSRTTPFDRQHATGGGGDVGAGLPIGIDGRGFGGRAAMGAIMTTPPETIFGLAAAAGARCCTG